MFGAAPAHANQAYAPDPCQPAPAVSPYCAGVTLDLRADHRARSNNNAIFAETGRDADGPTLDLSAGRLPPDRPAERTLLEARLFVSVGVPSAAGDVRLTLGARAQLETPPRRRDDPTSAFRRTGRRLLLERASIEVSNFTLGLAPSTFYFTPSLSYTTAYASEQNTTQLAYRFRLPGELLLAVALEDGDRRRVEDAAWGVARGGLSLDPVIALRKTTSWGAMQVAGALHPIRAEASSDCCRRLTSQSIGWAFAAGLEGWFETPLGSSEVLMNAGVSAGALDYLNATNYPADFLIESNGRIGLSRARALVLSAGNHFGRQIRAVVSFSRVVTEITGERFRFRTASNLVQASLEYIPRRGTVAGIELIWSRDEARSVDGVSAHHRLFTAVAYLRVRLSRNVPLRRL